MNVKSIKDKAQVLRFINTKRGEGERKTERDGERQRRGRKTERTLKDREGGRKTEEGETGGRTTVNYQITLTETV